MVNKALKTKLLPQNEPTGFGQWQTFHNLKPKVKPTGKDDVLKT
jgi:hypothetical protein